MANRLAMATVQAILQLHSLRWSQRRIAEELRIDRKTVRRHLLRQLSGPNAPAAPTGSETSKGATLRLVPAPDDETSGRVEHADHAAAPNAANAPTGSPAPQDDHRPGRVAQQRSLCEPYRDLILAKLDQGLSAQRIYQDLVSQHGFTARYWSVRRFVLRLTGQTPLPMRRMEVEPGEQAQIDFGVGAPIVGADGKRRKTHVFRIVLSHSRKGYSEATFTQTTEDFLGAIENACVHFGGVPKTLVIDNLKAAVAHPDWFDPELTPKLQSFCRHYGTVILPTKPYTPRHKGKIERGIGYVKGNALKARSFSSLDEQNRFLLDWEASIADTRIHGTTKRQVGKMFVEVERPTLSPLPLERFPVFHEAQRKVNRDGHIEVAKAYYSVPPEYLSRTVWARWDTRLVRVFNHRFEQIAIHVRSEPGRFSTQGEHLDPRKISGLERGAAYLLNKLSSIGPRTHEWASAMLAARGIEGTRVLQGLLGLAKKHSPDTLEKACETALSHGVFRLRTIRKLLGRDAAKQQPLPFLEEHPIIRPLDDYAAVVDRAIRRQVDRSSMSEGFERHGSGVRAMAEDSSPAGANPRGCDALSTRPRSEYPLPGCPSAEPGSVSPDSI
jgi:transposase